MDGDGQASIAMLLTIALTAACLAMLSAASARAGIVASRPRWRLAHDSAGKGSRARELRLSRSRN